MSKAPFAPRVAAFAVVVTLHGVLAATLLQMRAHAEAAPEASLMQVSIVSPERPQEVVPPPARPQLVLPLVPITMPLPEVPVIRIAESRAITIAPAQTPPPAPSTVVSSDAPVTLTAEEVDYVRRPRPHYPRAARQAHIQGTVLLWVLIDEEGRPQEVRVHRSSGHELLDREGCDAVRHATFTPYRRAGKLLRVQVIVPVEFSLNIRSARR